MTLEEIVKRYVKGYNFAERDHRNQLYNDMEWLMDQAEKVEKLFEENQDLIYENAKMRDYIKNYGITHGEIKK